MEEQLEDEEDEDDGSEYELFLRWNIGRLISSASIESSLKLRSINLHSFILSQGSGMLSSFPLIPNFGGRIR